MTTTTSNFLPPLVRRRIVWRGAVDPLLDWIVITLGFVLADSGSVWGIGLGVLLVASGQHRLAVLGHEGVHYLLFRNRRLNNLVSNILCMYGLGTTIESYRAWHFDHHRHVGTPLDPELGVKIGWKYRTPMPPWKIALLTVMDCLGFGIVELLRLQWKIRPRTARSRAGLIGFWSVVISIVWICDQWFLLGVWMISLVTLFWALFRIRALSEHTDITGTHRFQPHMLFRFALFPHGTWMHYEHHKWPSVPRYHLRKVRAIDTDDPVVDFQSVLSRLS